MMTIVDAERLDRTHSVTLLDGTLVSLRRLDQHDAEAVIAFHRDLTDRESYYRFFVVHPGFMHRLASKLVENSPINYAIGAFEAGRLIGVANYVRSNNPEVADVAIAVAHKDHLRGVATAMLRHLGKAARSNGIRYFVADILAENHAMLNAVRDAGWPYERASDNILLHIRVDLKDIR
jgi:RimJ/RimL family protein N-acetyltransferase